MEGVNGRYEGPGAGGVCYCDTDISGVFGGSDGVRRWEMRLQAAETSLSRTLGQGWRLDADGGSL